MDNKNNKFFIGLIIATIIFYIYYQLKVLDNEEKYFENQVIVSIGDEKVTNKYFSTLMKNKIEKLKKDENFSMKILENNETLNQLKSETMNELIEFKIYLDLAKKYDILIHDLEIKKYIEKQKAFHKFDKFDKEKYLSVLNEMEFSIKEYEDIIKDELMVDKFLKILLIINKDELNIINNLLSIEDAIKLDIINVEENKEQIFEEKELLDFYNNNKEELFKKKKTFHIKYIELKDNNNSISSEEIEKYYKDNYLEKYFNGGKIVQLDEVKENIKNDILLSKQKNINENQISLFKLNKINNNEIKEIEIEIEELDENNQEIFNNYEKNSFTIPFEYKNKKMIGKIINIVENKDKYFSFEKSIENIKIILQNMNSYKKAFSVAYNKIEKNDFSINIGYIGNKDYLNLEKYFNLNEAQIILNTIFHSYEFEGVIELDNKLVIYKVFDSRINKNNDVNNVLNSNEIEQYLYLVKKLELNKIIKEEYKNKVIFY